MKKIAMKGLVVLAICVALCMFFAGTIRTIVTPKVKIVTAKSGRLEQSVTLKGKLTFPETEDIRVDEARGQTLTVTRVNVRAGYEVKAGDVLFEMEMTDYDEKYQKFLKDYDEKTKKLADLDVTNRTLSKSNQRNKAYDAMLAAQKVLIEKKVLFSVISEQEGVRVPDDVKVGELQQYVIDHKGSEALGLAAAAYAEAQTGATRAESSLFSILADKKTKGKDGVFDYLKERTVIIAEIGQVERDMTDLGIKRGKLQKIVAPRDAYVTSVAVKVGDAYDGKLAALALSKANVQPVLRADLSEVRQTVDVGAVVTIKGNYQNINTKVLGTGIDIKGKKYADIEITQEVLDMTGGLYSLMLGDTDMTLSYRAKESTTLLPSSAVRSAGENDNYVWMIRWKYGGFTGNTMAIEKENVTVLQRGGKIVSIAEDLNDAKIADMEDRAISEGDTVMEYVN